MARLGADGSSFRQKWSRRRTSTASGPTVTLPWHVQPLAAKVDIEDKAAVLAALQRRSGERP